MSEITKLKIEQLKPNDWNPNRLDEEDQELLAERIKEKGEVDKPVTARPIKGGGYEIIDGEQTWRAAERAGLAEIPVIITELEDAEAIATTFVKNLHGEMNPIILGRNIIRMKELFAKRGEELSNPQAAKLMNKTEGTVRNYLLYAEAAQHVGSVPDWPDEAAIAALSVAAVRKLLDTLKAGDGGEQADDAAQLAKVVDRAIRSLSKLDVSALKRIRREIGKLIAAHENTTGEEPAEDPS
jgi:ParB/RepB/Spo0J family partition protein